MQIAIEKILPNPEQPREVFDKSALKNLAESIVANGIIEPLVVEESDGGNYILHDGERRLRAARIAGLKIVPVVIVPPLNGTAREERLTRALVANIQREDLNPIEEARAFQKMINDLGISINKCAQRLGVNTARIHMKLKLLKLDAEIQQMIAEDKLSHDQRLAEALVSLPDKQTRVQMAAKIAERGMTIPDAVKAIEKVKRFMSEEPLRVDDIPAVRLAVRQGARIRKSKWNALASAKHIPTWRRFEDEVRQTCDACSLRDLASEATCKECPLVFLVKRLAVVTK